ncbi:MAG: hypothetical protein ACXWP4_16340, partial [Polyangiales bacterium]
IACGLPDESDSDAIKTSAIVIFLPSGVAQSIKILETTPPAATALTDCVRTEIAKWTFVPGNGNRNVMVPLAFPK